jgi:hypothetical protein
MHRWDSNCSDATAPTGDSEVTAAETMTPLERLASTPKGQLNSLYRDFASVAEEGHQVHGRRLQRLPRRRRRWWHGRTFNQSCLGDDDDTLFRLIAPEPHPGLGRLNPSTS